MAVGTPVGEDIGGFPESAEAGGILGEDDGAGIPWFKAFGCSS